MGWVGSIADKIKNIYSHDNKVSEISKVYASNAAAMSMMGGGESAYSLLRPSLELDAALATRYRDYESMDEFGYISTALDVYANDITQPDYYRGNCLWVVSDDHWLKTEITNLFHGKLNIENEVWELARVLCMYGNAFGELLIDETGVCGINYLPPPSMRRIVDQKGALIGFIHDPNGQFQFGERDLEYFADGGSNGHMTSTGSILFQNWEVVHWRIKTKGIRSTYGFSSIEAARTVWKRLAMLEDASMMYRLERSPERLAFFIDVGNLPDSEARMHINSVKAQYKKKKFFNTERGGLDMRHNPLCITGDTKIPLIDGTEKTVIEMVSLYMSGDQQKVYSVDRETGRFVIGNVVFAGKTRENAEIVKVIFDNGESIKTTPDHKFIRANSEYVEAQDLKENDALMSYDIQVSVKSIAYLDETEDTYTLSIEKWHNFAVSAGVYIKNSMSDDFFIGSREGKDSTRIETIGGLGWTGMDDIEYQRKALSGALKVPGPYLGFGDDIPEKQLSHIDVHFARAVMNIQRELKNGFKHIGIAHLYAIGKDPNAFEWSFEMTKPTMIYELAQLEKLSAQTQSLQTAKDVISQKWGLKNIMQLTDEEISEIQKDHTSEIIADGKAQAKAQSFAMDMQVQAQQDMNASSEGGGGYEEESKRDKKLDKLGQILEKKIDALDKQVSSLSKSNGKMSKGLRETKGMMFDIREKVRNKRH